MTAIQAIVLGIVQGITEFLPISSSGHLVLVPKLLGWDIQPTSFDVTMHAATLLAILIYFKKDILDIFKQVVQKDFTLARNLIISSAPAAIIGALFSDFIDDTFKNDFIIVFMLISVGIIMIFSRHLFKKNDKKIEELTPTKALIIGISQSIAFIRGTSRSGITIIGGLAEKLTLQDAARYAFLAGIPVMLGASLVQFLDFFKEGTGSVSTKILFVGFISALISGIFSIKILLKFISKHGLFVFGIYRVILGIIVFFVIK